MIDPGLQDEVALVTGANAGIGEAIAKALAAQGAQTVLHYLASDDVIENRTYSVEHTVDGAAAANRVKREIEERGGRAAIVSGDLSDPDVIPRLFDSAEAVFGPVTVLVNNAAHCELPDTITETSVGSIDRHFAVNTRAAVLMIAEFVRRFQERGESSGRIINISTDAARAFATQISYGASKAALEAYTRSIAVEVGPLGITVNAIAPGPVQTGWIDAADEERLEASIPLGRVGTPDDVAGAVVFLASEQASWITGQVIHVSGGHTL